MFRSGTLSEKINTPFPQTAILPRVVLIRASAINSLTNSLDDPFLFLRLILYRLGDGAGDVVGDGVSLGAFLKLQELDRVGADINADDILGRGKDIPNQRKNIQQRELEFWSSG